MANHINGVVTDVALIAASRTKLDNVGVHTLMILRMSRFSSASRRVIVRGLSASAIPFNLTGQIW